MKTRILMIALALVAIWLVFDRVRNRGENEVAETSSLPEPQMVKPTDVIAYRELLAPTIRVRTTRDVLPGGYSAAMAPVMIDWDRTDVSPGGWVVVRNINAGGNPISGVTVLRTVRLRTDRVKRVEFTLVPLGGPKAVSHGQLRFVFEEDGIEFIGRTSEMVGEPDVPVDLILSWEAWRPPGADYDVLDGMDHSTYELSLRAYTGTQRFLEDALAKRGWESYTLQLPGGQAGLGELLRVGLALGDGAARHSIGMMLDHAEEEWIAAGPNMDREGGDALAHWRLVWETGSRSTVTASDPLLDMTGKTGYQSLIRSCATMALYTIDVTVARQAEAGITSPGMRWTHRPDIEDEPAWMAEMASTDLAGLFVRGPKALKFVRDNPTMVPSKIPGALDQAGLLVREEGKPVKRNYSMSGETPWGRPEHLLIK